MANRNKNTVKTRTGKDTQNRQKTNIGSQTPKSKKNFDNVPHTEGNDINWYYTSDTILDNSTQLSMQSYNGLPVIDNVVFPSIYQILLNPSLGNTVWQGSSSEDYINSFPDLTAAPVVKAELPTGNFTKPRRELGINQAAQKLFTTLSAFTGRTTTYSPSDCAIMLAGIASFVEYEEWLRRAFGIRLTYNPRNKDIPENLIRLMGIDFDDFVTHTADYRDRFNYILTQMNKIPILDNVGFIRKSREMFQKIYVDDATAMSQIFFYSPQTIWLFDEDSSESGSMLSTQMVCDPYRLGTNTMEWHLNMLQEMANALVSSTSLNYVYADILNLAQKVGVPTWQFDYLAENYSIIPEYSETALLQLHNLDIVGKPAGLYDVKENGNYRISFCDSFFTNGLCTITDGNNSMKITYSNDVYSDPNSGLLYYNPVIVEDIKTMASTDTSFEQSVIFAGSPSIVAFDSDSPDRETRAEALRMSGSFSGYGGGFWKIYQSDRCLMRFALAPALNDHYCSAVQVWHKSGAVEGVSEIPRNRVLIPENNDSASLETLTALELLKKHPIMYYMGHGSTSAGYHIGELKYAFCDLTSWTAVDYAYLSRNIKSVQMGLWEFRV